MTVAAPIRIPGDKSVSHRALMLAALGDGCSTLRGVLPSADVRATAGALRAMGVPVPALGDVMVVEGVGLRGLAPSADPLDCANSGTSTRLLAGVVAGLPFDTTFVGDASLSRRPMRRIARPLEAMGAVVELPEHGGLPMTVRGRRLRGVTWHAEVASAQVKSAILLAGLVGDVPVEVHEPQPTRDHTEQMLRARGVDVRSEPGMATLVPTGRLAALDVEVPGDPSSATFFAALAAGGAGERVMPGVLLNPLRIGALRVLRRMGAVLSFQDVVEAGGEPVGTLVVAPAPVLRATRIEGDEVPTLIDEIPMLACLAARAEGETVITGAAELRVKESDRIRTVVDGLRAVGASAEELPDGLVVRGSDRPLAGQVLTHGDHRIAMAFGVLGALSGGAITVDDPACCEVSFPGFWEALDHAR